MATDLIRVQRALAAAVDELKFGLPVTHVYNPLGYARRSAEAYVRRFANRGVAAILLGMNPGPFGMAQTGVPFGEVAAVRDWLGIEEPVDRPPVEHPKRPVLGFACRRSEVSGQRVWGWARDRFGEPAAFFARFFVWNYCPLVFMEEGGRNRTPDKLAPAEREALYRLCDQSLRDVVDAIAPCMVIGVGRFAQERARVALAGRDLPIASILHPSPASPLANRGWADQVDRQLQALGLS